MLVDYDNVYELEKQRGVVHVVTRILDSIGPTLDADTTARVRLYGGWFQGPSLSRRAQDMLPLIQAQFPRSMSPSGRLNPIPLRVRVELALSLEASPGRYFTHTFRDRALPGNVRCASLPYSGCRTPGGCPIASVSALLRDEQCPEHGCTVGLPAILSRPEQKLVDTMLTVDAIHFARFVSESLAIVSTDDDIWPAVMTAAQLGANVVHLHPVPGRSTPAHYLALVSGRYEQRSF